MSSKTDHEWFALRWLATMHSCRIVSDNARTKKKAQQLCSGYVKSPFATPENDDLSRRVNTLDAKIGRLQSQVKRLASEIDRLANETSTLEVINDELEVHTQLRTTASTHPYFTSKRSTSSSTTPFSIFPRKTSFSNMIEAISKLSSYM
mmetsp:Transcript_2072/g.4179  ORF Transcript_2072/g.4179 Transcript_2072/m.4179 type:complete len:149 (+) Transcript_2072:419-865(+)